MSRSYVAGVVSLLLTAAAQSQTCEPQELGVIGGSSARDVAIDGSLAYVANGRTFFIADIADPDSPRVLSTLELASGSVITRDGIVYLGSADEMLLVDAREPANPTPLPAPAIPGVSGFAIDGTHLWVSTSAHALLAFDISTPESPQLVSTLGPIESGRLDVSNGVACITTTTDLLVVDVTEPSAPSVAALFPLPHRPKDVDLVGRYAYVAADFALLVVDLQSPDAPTIVGQVPLSVFGRSVRVDGSKLYFADRDFGLRVFDVGDPSSPSLLGSAYTPGESRGISVGPDDIVWSAESALRAIDVSSPGGPFVRSELSVDLLPSRRGIISTTGDLAYICNADGEISTVDITDPTSPTHVGSTPYGWVFAQTAQVVGSVAHVADRNGAVQTIDLSDPQAPVQLDSVDLGLGLGEGTRDIVVRDGIMYCFGSFNDVRIIDATDPSSLSKLGTIPIAGRKGALAIAGHLLAAYNDQGLILVDTSDPAHPQWLSSPLIGMAVESAAFQGARLLATTDDGLSVFDVQDPTAPVLLNASGPDNATVVGVAPGAAILVANSRGYIIDIRDPLSLTLFSEFEPHASEEFAAMRGTHLLTANGGFRIADLAACLPCVPDFDRDGTVSTNDFFEFLAAYASEHPAADLSYDGLVNTNDFFTFLAAYQAGC